MTKEQPKDWQELWEAVRELKKPIDAKYNAAIAPLRRRCEEDQARVEREYREKLATAKSALAAAAREFDERKHALKHWHDATLRAIETEYQSARRPYANVHNEALTPVKEWEQRETLRLQEANP